MDVYFKKEIIYPFKGFKFKFAVAETLFSTFCIDHGTDILIRSIVVNNPKTILDLGCGYGPLGIILAKTNPDSQVTMVDSNLLAVRYTEHNLQNNSVSNATVLGGLGMESVLDKTFDLIVSNIPAKIGDTAITQEFIL
ncbi:MAG: methyltransferase, partial [bacterium]|nr:methyltransferase [bacterium]